MNATPRAIWFARGNVFSVVAGPNQRIYVIFRDNSIKLDCGLPATQTMESASSVQGRQEKKGS